nr:hypothetical protein [Rhizobium sp. 42MFCr.1]
MGAQDELVRERVDHVDDFQRPADPDRQAFLRELVDDVEHAEALSVVGAIMNEIVRPDTVFVQAEAGCGRSRCPKATRAF